MMHYAFFNRCCSSFKTLNTVFFDCYKDVQHTHWSDDVAEIIQLIATMAKRELPTHPVLGARVDMQEFILVGTSTMAIVLNTVLGTCRTALGTTDGQLAVHLCACMSSIVFLFPIRCFWRLICMLHFFFLFSFVYCMLFVRLCFMIGRSVPMVPRAPLR